MVKITYIQFNNTSKQVDVKSGQSVMEGAIRNNVPGIDADCGGACICATCHVFVDPHWMDRLEAPSQAEAGLLDFVEGVANNSRLACQIKVTDRLDGLVVRLPETQGAM
ncbi:2Fe-2S iron-sulfur cluster-binding protein [Asticcacaulis benevestitus]|uniref:2Fe-2S ferredoxin-type domain-containing protein n=1 Tax=Asticcacaulis benevestitus DSM 16100 = ATCC BAA-896 TaxID=1121022 RepID=V4PQD5_9CAUL|nr:2Fe-2S iron-sulfur cluster-binding protein [Asticcacaulis benevestitus]ESQ90511.1 hypothetical protein ABENE_12375 [Asticcacaulis benevestitus DSM 16100 = ATCC BAA-896]